MLEPRVMLDGAAVVDGIETLTQSSPTLLSELGLTTTRESSEQTNPSESDALYLAPTSSTQSDRRNELVFIDSRVDLSSVEEITADRTFVISNDVDAFAYMAEITGSFEQVDAIHVISHGADGELLLGNETYTSNNFETYRADLSALGSALTDSGDILFYACDLGATDDGREFIQKLSLVTEADIAASDDQTGGAGDSDLEVSEGRVDADELALADVLQTSLSTETFTQVDLSGETLQITGYAPLQDFGAPVGSDQLGNTGTGIPFTTFAYDSGNPNDPNNGVLGYVLSPGAANESVTIDVGDLSGQKTMYALLNNFSGDAAGVAEYKVRVNFAPAESEVSFIEFFATAQETTRDFNEKDSNDLTSSDVTVWWSNYEEGDAGADSFQRLDVRKFDLSLYSHRTITSVQLTTLGANDSDIGDADDLAMLSGLTFSDTTERDFSAIPQDGKTIGGPRIYAVDNVLRDYSKGSGLPIDLVSSVSVKNISSATVSITSNFEEGDYLSFVNDESTMGYILSSYDDSSGVLSLTSENVSTEAEWASALEAVEYYNINANQSLDTRVVSFVGTSVDGLSPVVAEVDISITPDISAPTNPAVISKSTIEYLALELMPNGSGITQAYGVASDGTYYYVNDNGLNLRVYDMAGAYVKSVSAPELPGAQHTLTYTNGYLFYRNNNGTALADTSDDLLYARPVDNLATLITVTQDGTHPLPIREGWNTWNILGMGDGRLAALGENTYNVVSGKYEAVVSFYNVSEDRSSITFDSSITLINDDQFLEYFHGLETDGDHLFVTRFKDGDASAYPILGDYTNRPETLSSDSGGYRSYSLTTGLVAYDGSEDVTTWDLRVVEVDTVTYQNPTFLGRNPLTGAFFYTDFDTYKNSLAVSKTTSIAGLEDTTTSLKASDFSSVYGGKDLENVRITRGPVHGSLYLSGTLVDEDQEIAIDDVALMTYVPDDEFSGIDSILWEGYVSGSWSDRKAAVITVGNVDDDPNFSITSSNPYSLDFDGSGDYLDAGEPLLNDLSTFTVSFWINPDNAKTGSLQSLVGQNDTFEIFLQGGVSTPTLVFWNKTAGGVSIEVPEISDGEWSHIGIRGDSVAGLVEVFVNGEFVAEGTHVSSVKYDGSDSDSRTKNFKVGGYVQDDLAPGYFAGSLDEISIWNISLNDAAMAELTNEKLQGTERGLIGYWNLDEGSGSTLSNRVPSGANLTLNDDPEWVNSTLRLDGLTYSQNAGTAISAGPGFTVTDVDSLLKSVSVTIAKNLTAGDVLAFTNDNESMGNIAASAYDSATGTLVLTSSDQTATMTHWENALGAVTFATTAETGPSIRELSWTVSDGINEVVDGSKINVEYLTVLGPTADEYVEGDQPVLLMPYANLPSSLGDTLTGLQLYIDNVQSGDVLDVTGTSASITTSYNSASGRLSFTGSATRAEYQALLRTVTFKNTETDPSEASRSIVLQVSPHVSLNFGGESHYYEYVADPGITWTDAVTDAAAKTMVDQGGNTLTGYLVTVTSEVENTFLQSKLAADAWMGATDSITEGTWKWATGPEANTQFFQGPATPPVGATITGDFGSVVAGQYASWDSNEPNNYNGNEDYAHFKGSSGKWNDYPVQSDSIAGYVVEYNSATEYTPVGGTFELAVSRNAAPTVSVTAPTGDGEFNVGTDSTVSLASGVSVADTDSDIDSAYVKITTNYSSSTDSLKYTYDANTMGDITGTFVSGTGILTLSSASGATDAEWDAALASIEFTSTDVSYPAADRTIVWGVSDGKKETTANTTVDMVYNPPVVVVNGTEHYYIETGSTHTFAAADFTDEFSYTSDVYGWTSIKINSLPTGGYLTLNGSSVAVDDTIALASLGGLVYTVRSSFTGTDTFGWSAVDTNGAPSNSVNFTFELDNAGAPDLSAIADETYVEQASPVELAASNFASHIWEGLFNVSGQAGYIDFEITANGDADRNSTGDVFSVVANSADPANPVHGDVRVNGRFVEYYDTQPAEGASAAWIQVGQIDSTYDGEGGTKLRIHLLTDASIPGSSPITNGDFNSDIALGSPGSGWTVYSGRVDFGSRITVGGVSIETPYDLDDDVADWKKMASAPSIQQDDNTAFNSGPTGRTAAITGEADSLFLYTGSMNIESYGVVHGPGVMSDLFVASAGDVLKLDYSADGSGDWYHVAGYLVDSSGDLYKMVLNDTGKSVSDTASVTIDHDGSYRFVFITGTFDKSGGKAAGASMTIDNIRAEDPYPINDWVVESIIRAVQYSNDSDDPDTNTKVMTLSVVQDSTSPATVYSVTSNIDVTAVIDAPTLTGNPTLPAITEDASPAGTLISSRFSSVFDDGDNDGLAGIAISGDASNSGEGVWQYSFDGAAWSDVGSVTTTSALMLDASTLIRFLPAANYHGTPGPLTVFAVDDGISQTFSAAGALVYFDTVANNAGKTAVSLESHVSYSSYSLTHSVTSVNDSPVLDSRPSDISIIQGDTFNTDFSGYFSDVDGDTLTFAATDIPAGLAFDTSSGILSGTSTTDDIHTVSLTATDAGGLSDSGQITFTVNPDLPTRTGIAAPSSVNVRQGQDYEFDFNSLWTSKHASTTGFSIDVIPPGLEFNTTTGVLTGRVSVAGPYSVTVTVTNSFNHTASVQFSMIVTPLPVSRDSAAEAGARDTINKNSEIITTNQEARYAGAFGAQGSNGGLVSNQSRNDSAQSTIQSLTQTGLQAAINPQSVFNGGYGTSTPSNGSSNIAGSNVITSSSIVGNNASNLSGSSLPGSVGGIQSPLGGATGNAVAGGGSTVAGSGVSPGSLGAPGSAIGGPDATVNASTAGGLNALAQSGAAQSNGTDGGSENFGFNAPPLGGVGGPSAAERSGEGDSDFAGFAGPGSTGLAGSTRADGGSGEPNGSLQTNGLAGGPGASAAQDGAATGGDGGIGSLAFAPQAGPGSVANQASAVAGPTSTSGDAGSAQPTVNGAPGTVSPGANASGGDTGSADAAASSGGVESAQGADAASGDAQASAGSNQQVADGSGESTPVEGVANAQITRGPVESVGEAGTAPSNAQITAQSANPNASPGGDAQASGGDADAQTATAEQATAQRSTESVIDPTTGVVDAKVSNSLMKMGTTMTRQIDRVVVQVGADGQVSSSTLARNDAENPSGLQIVRVVQEGRSIEADLADNNNAQVQEYQAVLVAPDGSQQPLPDWIKIDAETGKLTGEPPAGVDSINLAIKAVDVTGESRVIILNLNVSDGATEAPAGDNNVGSVESLKSHGTERFTEQLKRSVRAVA